MFTAQHGAIKGTTSGTPGTGAFTPNAAASGARAWSNVAAGWIGVVRFDDGSAWELAYSYWNGTTLSRSSAGFIDSSTGSQLSLTSAATAALVVSADAGGGVNRLRPFTALIGAAPAQPGGDRGIPQRSSAAPTAGHTVATTNFCTEQQR
jgi:hypothetical protein